MKKYLITGLAAVAISGMFTSCTHETDAGAGGTNLGVVETYEQAFISRFGTPSPDADWGFGPDANAGTRALESEYAGTYAKTAADYLEGLTVENMSQYAAFTDADLDQQQTLTNYLTQGTSTTTSQSATYKVAAGYDPTSGTSVDVMNGNTKVGTLTFGEPVAVSAGYIETSFAWGKASGGEGIISANGWDYPYQLQGAYKLDETQTITLTPVMPCMVTIEQSKYDMDQKKSNTNTLKFDDNELSVANASDADNSRTYTINDVNAGTHTISMGSGVSGVHKVTITYAATSAATTDDKGLAYDGYTSRIARTYYRFTPEIDGTTLTFYHKQGASSNAITIKDNDSYFKSNNQDFHNWSCYNSNIDLYHIFAGHTYELTLNTAEDGCYGVKMNYNVTTTTEPTYIGGSDGRHYRVASGTTITKAFHANGNDENNQPMMNGVVVYVEGTLNLYKENTLNGVTIVVADGGHVILNGEVNMSNYGRFVVLGNGSITGTDGSSLKINNGAKSYNAGTIDYNGELNVNGSDFYNCGTINLTSMRNTSGGKITNFGHITCGTNKNAADAYNCEMINGCYWHYTGNAGIGKLTMLKNSRLDVDGKAEFTQSWQNLDVQTATPYDLQNATIASPNILMDKSVVNVGTAYVTNTVFQGPSNSDEFAIVKMGKVEVGNGTDLMQRQNCYFDWDITELYNKQSVKYQDIPEADKQYNPWGYLVDYYRVHVTKFATPTNSKFYIPAAETDDDCTGAGYGIPGGGNTPTPEPEPEPTPTPTPTPEQETVVRVVAEDMGDQSLNEASDFDFNDVVFDVTYVEEGKVRIKILAAGGTLPLTIGWDGTGDYITHEVHYRLGYSESTMINTHSEVGYHQDDVSPKEFDYTGTFSKASFKQDVRDNIPVKVRKNGVWYDIKAEKGKIPRKLAVGTNYDWCDERVDIDDWWLDSDKQGLFSQYASGELPNGWYQAAKFRKLRNRSNFISVSY